MARRRWDHRRSYLYTEAVVIDRVLDENVQTILRMLPCESGVSPTGFFATVDTDFSTSEMKNLVDRTFDAWLRFYNVGPRELGFRIPTRVLSAETVAPYVVGDILEGLAAEVDGDDLVLRFRMDGQDNELFNLHEQPSRWLRHILPVREELMSGRLDALDLGPLIGTFFNHLPGLPDLPAEYGLSKACRILAAYLLVAPKDLESRAAARSDPPPQDEPPPQVEPPAAGLTLEWLAACADLTPVARWEFATAAPRRSFQIRLGRLPDACKFGSWYVSATEPRGRPLAFPTEAEARRGYHDEALRLQRLNGRGRWHELDPS
jgi:hypothetical protein